MSFAAESGLACAAGTICTPGGATCRWNARSTFTTFTTPPTFDRRPTPQTPHDTTHSRTQSAGSTARLHPRAHRSACEPSRKQSLVTASPLFAMARLLLPLAALAALAPLAGAIKFTTPKPGATLTGGQSLTVEWADGGDGPAIADLATYELFLCAGSSETFVSVSFKCRLSNHIGMEIWVLQDGALTGTTN
jgi:hypothetical protein